MTQSEDEHQAARDARTLIVGELTWDSFIMKYGETDSERIGVLVDIIEHEPKRGGFLGVREEAILALEKP